MEWLQCGREIICVVLKPESSSKTVLVLVLVIEAGGGGGIEVVPQPWPPLGVGDKTLTPSSYFTGTAALSACCNIH
ncbi:conserved hypothetical protein [Ricinus communis]|uniref:Uncharacterized protein n=1 Tax=Ricinus communis TaxID=3988 RepID=B9R8W1_RICCO|nr:conserved hypothetical protein [Ricinus communis]